MIRQSQMKKLNKNKEKEDEANYLALLLNVSLKQAEDCKGSTRDFFLAQSMRIEDQIQRLGFKIKKNKPKKKKVK